MKNLKKVLSLVLALAMALSLMTVAFAAVPKASSLTNYDKVGTTYKEAVDVMVAIGVIDGVSGDIQAQGNVTREQAAKIICTMLMGSNASQLTTTSKYFSDVPATRWSAPYIAYCVEKGIVSGIGGGKYNPTGNVTGNQFAKMLLVALGYDASIQGYTGTNWAVNVSSDATDAGLYKGAATLDKNAAATREQACLYAFNTLKANMVKYENKGTTITIGNANIAVGASTPATIANDDFDYRTPAADNKLQFCEKYFYNTDTNGSRLVKTSATNDAMGRPASVWYYGANGLTKVGTYAQTPVATYTTITKASTALTALGLNANTNVAVYVNGTVQGTAGMLTAGSATALVPNSGMGTVVELYKLDSKETVGGTDCNYREVVTQYTFNQAAVKTVAANAAHGAYTQYTVGGTAYKVFSTTVTSSDVTTAAVTGTVANGDEVLYYVDNASVAHIFAVEKQSGTVSAKTSAGAYTVGGATMYQSSATNSSGLTVPTVNTSKSQTFYVDSYGYILTNVAASSEAYAMVIKTGTSSTLNGTTLNTVQTATLAYPDGTVATVALVDGNDDVTAYTSAPVAAGTVVTYSTMTNGTYIAAATNPNKVKAATGLTKNSTTIGGVSEMVAGTATNFVYVDWNAAGTKTLGTVTMKTGIANISNSTFTTGFAVDTDASADGVANVVYVYSTNSVTSVSDFVYLTGAYTQTGTNTYTLNAFVKGEATTITVNQTGLNAFLALNTNAPEAVYSAFTVANLQTITATPATALKTAGGTDVTGMKVSGGVLFVTTGSGYTVCDNTTNNKIAVGDSVAVYDIDYTNNTVSTYTAGTLTTALEGTVYVQVDNSTDKNIAAIYVYHAA